MIKPTFTEIDYIANLLYQQDALQRGCIGVRWWCHDRLGSRKRWLAKARKAVTKWAAAEKKTMKAIDAGKTLV